MSVHGLIQFIFFCYYPGWDFDICITIFPLKIRHITIKIVFSLSIFSTSPVNASYTKLRDTCQMQIRVNQS